MRAEVSNKVTYDVIYVLVILNTQLNQVLKSLAQDNFKKNIFCLVPRK